MKFFCMVQKLHKMGNGFNFNAIIVNKFTDRGRRLKEFAKKFGRLAASLLPMQGNKLGNDQWNPVEPLLKIYDFGGLL